MRNCECIGNPKMFQSRVMCVGDVVASKFEICSRFAGTTGSMYCSKEDRLAVCDPNSSPGTCKPKSSSLLLPLILGAAYLLLS